MRLGLPLVLTLVCSAVYSVSADDIVASDAGGECISYEYPIEVYRPEAKRHSQLYGMNRFATLEMCERERAREEAANAAMVDWILKRAPKARIAKWNFGQCRCDRTYDPGSSTYLEPERRATLDRIMRDARFRIEWEAEDKGLSSQSQVARDFAAATRLEIPPGAWPLVSTVPEDSEILLLDPERTELMETSVEVVSADSIPTLDDLEMVEITFEDLEDALILEMADSGFQTNPFIAREIDRIETLLPQAFEIDDAAERDRVVTILQERLLLLANLDKVIESAGPESTVRTRSIAARTEEEVSLLVEELFGRTVAEHWSPETLGGVVFDLPIDVTDDPVAVLRSTDEIDAETKRSAVYSYLVVTPVLTENEELWLAGLIEEGLAGE